MEYEINDYINEDDNKFNPTEEWMKDKYLRLNEELFNGYLGNCILIPHSKKNTNKLLGCFRLNGYGLKINLETRELFQQDPRSGLITYVDRYNFEDICQPSIEFNAHYKATEEAWLNVLVHEMCHYYTYCDGYSPKQGHGKEFRQIASLIQIRSNGRFNVQRVASSEEMSNFELNDLYQQKEDNKIQKLGSKISILIGVDDNRKMRLVTTSSQQLINEILKFHQKKDDMVFIGIVQNTNLYKFLVNKKYTKNFRSYRYWNITDKIDVINEILKYNINNLIKDGCSLQEAIEFMKYGGKVFVTKNNSFQESINDIVNSVIKEFMEDKNPNENNSIDITPDDELELFSPLEKLNM